METTLIPTLAVRGAAGAIDFYRRALHATELTRYTVPGGRIVHADLQVGGALFAVKETDDADLPPEGATPVILTLEVSDADAVWASLLAAGARELFPLDDQVYGYRQGRVVDPYGHQWIVSQMIEDLTPAQRQSKMDSFSP